MADKYDIFSYSSSSSSSLSYNNSYKSRSPMVEKDLIGVLEEKNYKGTGVNVALTISPPSPPPLKKCLRCSKHSTPLWRNGPYGPQTLCNACGLWWYKQMSTISTELKLGPSKPPAKRNRHRRRQP